MTLMMMMTMIILTMTMIDCGGDGCGDVNDDDNYERLLPRKLKATK